MNNRFFSIPYSDNIDVDEYLNFISDYDDYIENIYLGLPDLDNHISLQFPNICRNNSLKLLSKQSKYKNIVVYNSMSYNDDDYNIHKYFEERIYPLIELYKIDGFVITNLSLAIKIHHDYPKLELHTSCNGFQWTIRQMDLWRHLAGIEIFNPPREAARTPSMLKEMYNEGFKLKVLVNEACLYGCPYMYIHASGISENTKTYVDCMSNDYANALRTNLFLPRWLESIDEYVYCYKLSGRSSNTKILKKIFDSYILQKPFTYIDEIATYSVGNGISKLLERNIRIKESYIPDKLKYCECKECNKTCFICSDLMSRINPI